MAWLRARTGRVDTASGEVLTGHADPLGVIRDTVILCERGHTSARFAEALLQCIRDDCHEVRRAATTGEHPQRLFSLAVFLELGAALPLDLVAQGTTLSARRDEVSDLLVTIVGRSDPLWARLIQASFAFLLHVRQSFPLSQLRTLLNYPATARLAFHALRRCRPEETPPLFADFARACVSNQKAIIVDVEIERLSAEMDQSQIRALLVYALHSLDDEARRALLAMPTAASLVRWSDTIETIKRTQSLRYSYKGYLEKEEPTRSLPDWAFDLVNTIHRRIQELTAVQVRLVVDPGEATWDEQAFAAGELTFLPLDPIFLTPRRFRRGLSVVPSGYVENFEVVCAQGLHNREFVMRMRSCGDLSQVFVSDCEIGVLYETAATEELRERGWNERREFTLEQNVDLESLLQSMLRKQDHMVLVVDAGMASILERLMNTKFRDTIYGRRVTLVRTPLPYRRAVLAGIPYPRNDDVFGYLLRNTVDEVLYQSKRICDDSDVARALRNVGITPLTRSRWEVLKPWVPVVDVALVPDAVSELGAVRQSSG